MVRMSHEGLRDRRRRETRQEIHAATLRLARAHGYERVTVEMISAEAGVSPRTFFNYFATKEEAVLSGPQPPADDLVEAFVAAGPAHPRQVLADLTTLLVTDLARRPPARREMHDVFEVMHAHPAVLAAFLARMDAFGRALAAVVARRLGLAPDDEVPALITAVALTAVRNGLERWSAAEPADADDSPVPYVRRAAGLLDTLFSPDPAPDTARHASGDPA
jgi:AcrR family transcriptional regulator